MDVDYEKFFDEETVLDASSLNLRAYYIHPETTDKYVSFPVTQLFVPLTPVPAKRRYGNQRSFSQMLQTGFTGEFSVVMPVEAEELLERYGVSDYGDKYFIGVFRDTDKIAMNHFLEVLKPWEGEETGILKQFVGTAKPTKPYEYYWTPENKGDDAL